MRRGNTTRQWTNWTFELQDCWLKVSNVVASLLFVCCSHVPPWIEQTCTLFQGSIFCTPSFSPSSPRMTQSSLGVCSALNLLHWLRNSILCVFEIMQLTGYFVLRNCCEGYVPCLHFVLMLWIPVTKFRAVQFSLGSERTCAQVIQFNA